MTAARFLLVLLPVAALSAAEPPATGKRYVAGPDGGRVTAVVAAKGLCAWPVLVPLPDGTLTAFVFNQPSHGRMVGDVECWASTDGGAAWARRGVAAPHDPGTKTNRMNVAAGPARNGDLLLLSSGWSLKPHPTDADALEIDRVQPLWVSRSADGGKTWAVDKKAFPDPAPGAAPHIPHGSVVVAHDGALCAGVYAQTDGKSTRAAVARSTDDGKTWAIGPPIDPDRRLNETHLWHAGGGRWLAAARGARLEIYESADDAKTWRHLTSATENNAVPGMILKLADGRLLLTHGNRTKGDERVEARLSADGGKTWSAPARLVDFEGFDGGYPSSVQRADGRVVTGYYAKKTAGHDGYHFGVVAWDPAATFGKHPCGK